MSTSPAKAVPRRAHAAKSPRACAVRRKKLVRALIDGKNLRNTAISTGLSPATAQIQASQILNHPISKQLFSDYMEKEGITDQILTQKLKKLLDARQQIFFQHKGHVVDTRETEALETQRKVAELCCRLRGHLQEIKATPDISIHILGAVISALRADQD